MNKQIKHTTGPWIAGRLPYRNGDGYSYGGECTVTLGDGLVITLESERAKDASLIAAAPDLLGALAAVMEYTQDMEGHEDWPALRDSALDAIAKATTK